MFIAIAAAAQLQAAAPCAALPYQEFDFWVGDWVVTTADGNTAGHNSITKQEGGCLIVEKWTSASGGTGQSYNFYNPSTNKWRQIWLSNGTMIDYSGGLNDDGEMALKGEIVYHGNPERPLPFRGTWSPMPDGTVRQHFEQFNPETKEWDGWFTGTYTRVE